MAETQPIEKFPAPKRFPYTSADESRLDDYDFFYKLFTGAHFEAFKIKIKSEDFNKTYAKMRYLYVNFAGMLSRIVADMLFGEPLGFKVDDKDTQAWLEDFWDENKLDILFYESALGNSALGDAVFKLRVGNRNPKDTKSTSVFLEQVPPNIYFPRVDAFNISGAPEVQELAWVYKVGNKSYLRRSIYEIDKITNKAYLMKGNEIEKEVSLAEAGLPDLKKEEEIKGGERLIIHTPNWKTGDRHFGFRVYNDLDSIFFALNNRISKIDNVLDTHTDPFLMVPDGVLDENGKVKRDGRIIEMGEGENGKPEYIVWDASLENAFKQIDKLVEFYQMVGEMSPDVNGMGQGQSDSGRALKFKLMRVIAKINRKKLYYNNTIREALYTAQVLAKSYKATAKGKPFSGEPVYPDLVWQDGLPSDDTELITNEAAAIDAGIESQKRAIMKVQGVDEETATKMIADIDKEKAAKMPAPLDPSRNPFAKPAGGDPKAPTAPKQ